METITDGFKELNVYHALYDTVDQNKHIFQMKKEECDGWVDSDPCNTSAEKQECQIRIKKEAGLNLLGSVSYSSYSLIPDMVFGWRPKLPSCPLPLSYCNAYVDAVKGVVDASAIVYMGRRPPSSVEVNLSCPFTWKYRGRYCHLGSPSQEVVSRGECRFDSSFESGNMDMVVSVGANEYDCYIRSDTNTRGHTNWYYFSVQCTNPHTIHINICNFGKQINLYTKGMRPYTRIDREWSQDACFDVSYSEGGCRQGTPYQSHRLEFKYQFRQSNEKVYFAYCIPYTYTQLQCFVREVCQSQFVTSSKLCESLGGVTVPLLTISQQKEGVENGEVSEGKRAILVTARIHPGQAHASYMVEGFVRRLLEEDMEIMRRNIVVYVVPMLNPDGVIAGNYRTSYSGRDLNRQFNALNKYVYPQVTHLHELAHRLTKTYSLDYYFDFHGHSTKKGLFCYGPEHPLGATDYFRARIFAKTIQSLSPLFLYRKSIFTISAHKRNTARAHMLWEMGVAMSFTFEVSNGLHAVGTQALSAPSLLEAGAVIMHGFYKFNRCSLQVSFKPFISSRMIRAEGRRKSKLKTVKEVRVKQSDDPFIASYIKEIEREKTQVGEEVEEGGSDSEGEEDDLTQRELTALHTNIMERGNKKKRNISKKYIKQSHSKTSIMEQQVSKAHIIVKSKKIVSSKYLNASKNYRPLTKIIRKTFATEKERVAVAPHTFFMGF